MIYIYRYLFYPIFYWLVYLLRYSHPKLRAYFRLRKKPYKNLKVYKNAYWFHCSSGEIEYAKPILKWLRTNYPEEKILVTYFSSSILENIKKIHEVDMIVPLPFDTKASMQDFLKRFSPKFLFIARTDLWPEMLHQSYRAKIPCVLFSATLAEDNPKFTNPIARFLFQDLLHKLDMVICVSDEDASRFRSFKIKQLEIASDTRYIQVIERLKHKKQIPIEIKPDRPVLILGSTWPQDEAQLLPVCMDILTAGYQVILVPHEVSKKHLKSLYEDMDYQCLTYDRFSKVESWTTSDILVVDQVGFLADLYAYAEIAFVGGSFKKQCHSVMEALASGCVTFVGPKHKNNREALDFQDIRLQNIAPVQVIQNGKHLVKRIQYWKKEAHRKSFKQSLVLEVEKRAKEAHKTFEILHNFIKTTDARHK